jgi:hypothetical protein
MSSSTAVKMFLLGRGFPVEVVRAREASGQMLLTVLLADGASRETGRRVLAAVADYLRDNDLAGDCDVLVPL